MRLLSVSPAPQLTASIHGAVPTIHSARAMPLQVSAAIRGPCWLTQNPLHAVWTELSRDKQNVPHRCTERSEMVHFLLPWNGGKSSTEQTTSGGEVMKLRGAVRITTVTISQFGGLNKGCVYPGIATEKKKKTCKDNSQATVFSSGLIYKESTDNTRFPGAVHKSKISSCHYHGKDPQRGRWTIQGCFFLAFYFEMMIDSPAVVRNNRETP